MAYKLIFTFAAVIAVMVFALQNAAIVSIRLLFWEVTIPRSLLIFMMLLVGAVIGWFARSIFRISRSHK